MAELKINGMPATVGKAATVLEAAELVFAEVPTLCHLKGAKPETSCMLCVVKDLATGQLIPACSTRAVDGMEIDTECEEVRAARRDILNLLLSEHVGDCEAPCTRICPAHLDIPLMLREIGRGNAGAAAWIAQRDLAIPSILGHICPAPCEKGCRRGQVDQSITIRALHCVAGKMDHLPSLQDKKVAVIGSGAAGLACAWQLRLMGYGCTVFDEKPQAGGALRENKALPVEVLNSELERLHQAGIEFELNRAISLHEISEKFVGVVFASSGSSETQFADAFYAEEHKLAVKAVANGKKAALDLDCFLRKESPKAPFDSRIGKLRASELKELCKNTFAEGRQDACDTQKEAGRCLHCDCRKPVSCKLRKYAAQHGADQRMFFAEERGHVQLVGHGESVVFEPGKCIKCGLCVKIAKRAGEEPGLAFVGRGFNVQVQVPFGGRLRDGLKQVAQECVEACPTGALAFREGEER